MFHPSVIGFGFMEIEKCKPTNYKDIEKCKVINYKHDFKSRIEWNQRVYN